MHSPTGFRTGTASDALHSVTGTADGTCPAEATIGPGGWVRYRAGSQ